MAYFQGGEFVELLGAQGKAPAASWKLQGKVSKTFDKSIKGNAFHLDGSSETKMQLPKTASSALGLAQRFVVLQLLVPFTRSFSVEICFSDFQKVRRRFVVASAFRETTRTALHVQLPLSTGDLPRDQWMNLVFDLQALSEVYFPDSGFRSMESICVGGSCRLKRVFTMKDAPTPSRNLHGVRHADIREIPRQFVLSAAHRGASEALPVPTVYFAMMPTSDAGMLEITGKANAAPKKFDRRSQTAPTNTQAKVITKGVRGMRPNSGVELKAPTLSTRRLNTKGSKAIVTGQQRLRTPANVNSAHNRPQPRPPKSPSSDRRSPRELLSSAFGVEGPCHNIVNENQDDVESTKRIQKQALNEQDQENKYAAAAPTHFEICHEQIPLRSAQTLLSSSESNGARSSSVKPPRDSDTGRSESSLQSLSQSHSGNSRLYSESMTSPRGPSAGRNGGLRQAIMGEIQQKIAFLENEDDRADQRSRELFLRHTSLLSGEWHPQDKEDQDRDSTQLSDDEFGDTTLSPSWRREFRDANVEPSIESSDIKQHLSQVATSMEALMTSPKEKDKKSIFLFPQSAERGVGSFHRSTSRLFDFDSLLQDGKFEKSLEQDTPPVDLPLFANAQPHIRSESADESAAESEDDTELMELLAAKHSVRQLLRQTDLSNDVGVLHGETDSTTGPSKDRQEAIIDSGNSMKEETGAPVLFPHIPTDTAVPEGSPDKMHNKVVDVIQPTFIESPLERDDDRAESAQDSDPNDDDNALSIDLTSELSGEHDQDLNEFENSTSRKELASPHTEKCSPASDNTPTLLNDHDSDSSFDFEDLVGENGSSDEDERSEDKKGKHRSIFSVSSNHASVEQVRPSRKLCVARSQSQQNQQDGGAVSELPRRSVKSPPIESQRTKRDQDKPQRTSIREWPPTPPHPVDLSSSFSCRRLQQLLESTDWTAELSAHVDTIGADGTQSQLRSTQSPLRSNDQVRKSSRRHPLSESKEARWSTAKRSSSRELRKSISQAPSTTASIELVYDPVLQCYYDPIGNKYYALAE